MQVRRRVWLSAATCAALMGAMAVPAVSAPSGAPTAVTPPAVGAAVDDDGVPYPRQEPLTEPPVDEDDQSNWRGAIPFHEIAPTVNEWMEDSEYVSAEVVGQSSQGRDLYLVTITAPETAEESAQQDAWREAIKHDAANAQEDAELLAGYKAPIWFNNNIHGNEWDGTDASMSYIAELVEALEAGDEEALALVEEHRLYFTLSNNPDGRVAGTRATALNLDANRDFITNTTPETRAIRDLTGDLQPVFFIDLHGYTGVLQVEPTGPPQGENYEHDLLMPYSYAAALRIEEDVVDAAIEGNPLTSAGGILIPYRDTPSGWDGWPPIFTPQYVQFQGSIAYTVELGPGRTNDLEENARRLEVNRQVGHQVIESTVAYVAENRDAILGNQMEIFRRGEAGEPLVEIPASPDPDDYAGPDEWAAEWDEADVTGTEFPRAYVIPAGSADAATLVDHLIAHGVEVGVADAAFTAGGEQYPAGTFVVDMHQPLRGLANVLLSDGSDISERVPTMYDISAWSLGRLWGAEVDRVGETTDPALDVTTTPIDAAPATGGFPEDAQYVSLVLDGVAEVRALNRLLAIGAAVVDVGDGRYVVGPEWLGAARAAAQTYGVTFTATDGSELAGDDVRGVSALRVGYTTGSSYGGEDELVLEELGFVDPVRVTVAGLTDGSVDLDEIDVLWLGAQLRFPEEDDTARDAVAEYLAAGKGVVASAQAGAALAAEFELFDVTAVNGPGRANGVVLVETAEDGVISAQAEEAAFTYGPAYFTDLGEGVTVEQTYAAEPLLSGHWLPTAEGTGGPEQAGGQPSVVSAESEDGARVLVFGTDPLFRTHPRGMFDDVAAALLWAGPEGAGIEPPAEEPTEEPTGEPTEEPTGEPTQEPTGEPTQVPTEEPTATVAPTEAPTDGTGGRLPTTGAEAWPLLLLTVLLAGGGAVLVARRRVTE